MKNIAHKLFLVLITTTAILLCVVSLTEYYQGQKSINKELEYKIETIINRLTLNLKQSVYEYDIDLIRDVCRSEFRDPVLTAVMVWEEDKTALLLGLEKQKDNLIQISDEPLHKNLIRKDKSVFYFNKATQTRAEVGALSLYFDRTVLEKKLVLELSHQILKTGFIIILLLGLLSIIVNRLIVTPLEMIRADMLEVEEKALNPNIQIIEPYSIEWMSNRITSTFSEIKQVATIYQKMLQAIFQRQKDLKESERRYRSLFESASMAILLMDGSRIIDFNPNSLNMFGKKEHDTFRGPLETYCIPGDNSKTQMSPDILLQRIEKALFGKTQIFEWKFLKENGSVFDAEVSLNCIQLQQVTYVYAFIRDITTRKKAEEELNITYSKLGESYRELQEKQEQLVQSEKMAALGILSSGIAHEINQPLMGISMGLENMMFDVVQDELELPAVKEKCSTLLGYVKRIKSTIEHVRVFSREQKSKDFNICNLNESIENALMMVRTQYKNHRIKIEKNLTKKNLPIMGNLYRLEQVIINLLANARDALEEKAIISEPSFEKQIIISAGVNADQIYVTIRDNGIGIKPEDKKHIFEPFFTTKEASRGTGLGMAVSYSLIDEMAGQISVESEYLTYTEFKLSFPIIQKNIS